MVVKILLMLLLVGVEWECWQVLTILLQKKEIILLYIAHPYKGRYVIDFLQWEIGVKNYKLQSIENLRTGDYKEYGKLN